MFPWLGEGVFISEGTTSYTYIVEYMYVEYIECSTYAISTVDLNFCIAGAKWFLQRKFLTSSFHFKILDSFTETFADKGLSFVKKLESKANGTYFDIVPDSAVCTLGVICGMLHFSIYNLLVITITF